MFITLKKVKIEHRQETAQRTSSSVSVHILTSVTRSMCLKSNCWGAETVEEETDLRLWRRLSSLACSSSQSYPSRSSCRWTAWQQTDSVKPSWFQIFTLRGDKVLTRYLCTLFHSVANSPRPSFPFPLSCWGVKDLWSTALTWGTKRPIIFTVNSS